MERHRPETDCHAEDFPEDKYDFNPVTVQRSFADELLHVAGSNDLFTQVARGQKPVDDESRAHYPAKAAVVAYLKKSFGEGAAVIQAKGDRGMTENEKDAESGKTLQLTDLAYEIIEHSGKFYGQLVVYYRIAGLVPPNPDLRSRVMNHHNHFDEGAPTSLRSVCTGRFAMLTANGAQSCALTSSMATETDSSP